MIEYWLKKLSYTLTILFLISCNNGVSCDNQLKKPSTFVELEYQLENTEFSFIEELGLGNSSWITNCFYYSCDLKTGYFVLQVKDKKYFHGGVPLNYWISFKKSKSKGSFYNQNIRGKFKLSLLKDE
ncbi:KTSC domain-containing protein [Lacihabitans lacunae]|uniref:KTSC domain-containing protein n=1 Tax=Lacihabitans lacunae TaxID=1028214 RepID=A0ABV7YRQ9_9BACT